MDGSPPTGPGANPPGTTRWPSIADYWPDADSPKPPERETPTEGVARDPGGAVGGSGDWSAAATHSGTEAPETEHAGGPEPSLGLGSEGVGGPEPSFGLGGEGVGGPERSFGLGSEDVRGPEPIGGPGTEGVNHVEMIVGPRVEGVAQPAPSDGPENDAAPGDPLTTTAGGGLMIPALLRLRADTAATYSEEAYSDRVYSEGVFADEAWDGQGSGAGRRSDAPIWAGEGRSDPAATGWDEGAPHQGAPHQGAPHQGAPHQGAPHQGYPGQGDPGQGDSGQGDSGPPSRVRFDGLGRTGEIPTGVPTWERDTEGYDVVAHGSGGDDKRNWKPVLALVAAVAFLVGSGVVLANMVIGDEEATALPSPGPSATAPPAVANDGNPPVSVEPAPPNPDSATFELVSDTTELRVSLARLDRGLFALTTPDNSGVVPRAELDGDTLRLTVTPNGDNGSGRVDIVLDDRTTWAVKMSGGVRDAVLDLSKATSVPRVDLVGGAATIDMTLPDSADVVPIRMTGGVNKWNIRTATEVPVKVQLRRGAGEVVINGDRTKGIAEGKTLTRKADEEAGGLDLDAVAGVGSLTVAAA